VFRGLAFRLRIDKAAVSRSFALPDDRECSVILQDNGVHVLDSGYALGANSGADFFLRDPLPFERARQEFAPRQEESWLPIDDPLRGFRTCGELGQKHLNTNQRGQRKNALDERDIL
jgi:hypothetical protein